MTLNGMGDFIISEGYIEPGFHPDVLMYECEFEPGNYSENLFAHYGIVLHSSLNNAVNKRKSEFLAGRYVCKKALADLGVSDVHIDIGKNRSPIWPEGVKGSITHTTKTALCAVSRSDGIESIGVDRENRVAYTLMEEIQQSIICEDEKRYLCALGIPVEIAFTIAFSAKESLFKAGHKYVGKYFGFDAAHIVSVAHEGDSGYFVLKLNDSALKQCLNEPYVKGDYRLLGEAVMTMVVIESRHLR